MHLVGGRILPDSIIINLDLEVLGQPHEAYSVKTRIKCLNVWEMIMNKSKILTRRSSYSNFGEKVFFVNR